MGSVEQRGDSSSSEPCVHGSAVLSETTIDDRIAASTRLYARYIALDGGNATPSIYRRSGCPARDPAPAGPARVESSRRQHGAPFYSPAGAGPSHYRQVSSERRE